MYLARRVGSEVRAAYRGIRLGAGVRSSSKERPIRRSLDRSPARFRDAAVPRILCLESRTLEPRPEPRCEWLSPSDGVGTLLRSESLTA